MLDEAAAALVSGLVATTALVTLLVTDRVVVTTMWCSARHDMSEIHGDRAGQEHSTWERQVPAYFG